MRALCVIHFPIFGGPHNLVHRLSAPLRAHGWETTVLLPDEPGNAAERLRADGVDVVTMPLHRLRATVNPLVHVRFVAGFVPEVRAIRRLIRERKIDLVQIGGLVNPHAAIAARLEHIPVVWQLLDTRAPWAVALGAMTFVRQLADAVMSTGRSVASAHPGSAALEDRLVLFFPPVDVDAFRPGREDRAAVRADWRVPVDAPVVGCVANVNPQKGIVDLVRAFTLVRDRIPSARLVLVGAEHPTHVAYSAEVRDAIAQGGLLEGRDVMFVGARFDLERQLTGFDVFAFAAVPRGEGITTAVLEAMATGLPVVTTAVAGLPEAIEDGVNGRLVPPLDPPALARAIVEILTDPVLAARLSKAARSRAVERFATGRCVDDHLTAYGMALAKHGRAPAQSSVRSLGDAGLVCPVCRTKLESSEGSLDCPGCDRKYPVNDGIPVLVPDLAMTSYDEIDHHAGRADGDEAGAHKTAQAAHFDRGVAEQFEITRPHGTPRLYRFLLREKFRRATAPIGHRLIGASALTVCGGSGIDAEFLARAGARVVTSDISLGAARRARQRSSRYGLAITSIVADVEHLPFASNAFDLVFVHDGLHHLERPEAGVAEMARVAKRWVSLTEPTSAAATRVAIKAGLALEHEEAGNLVARLTPAEMVDVLGAAGFRSLAAQRYAMYYRHDPGSVFRILSQPWIFPVIRAGWRAGNAALGRVGNKMVVVAEREDFNVRTG
jgi:glycosyltransferase involved in cell wall biosynthesis/ubiquinone/menaquinone biosynthesis C-methylase UbiE/uncharacterized protein YbaR (Trm112 family)